MPIAVNIAPHSTFTGVKYLTPSRHLLAGHWVLSRTGFRACVTISAPNRQGLKPFSFQTLYGTVETVPHKNFLVATQALQPVGFRSSKCDPALTNPHRLKPAPLSFKRACFHDFSYDFLGSLLLLGTDHHGPV